MASPIIPLNLPKANLELSQAGNVVYVQCLIRRKKIVLTPEEWVRQHLINFLVQEKKISKALIALEFPIDYNGLSKRCDIVVFNSLGRPEMVIECKAPDVKLTENVYHQIASYNAEVNVHRLLVSNGIQHIACLIENGEIHYTQDLDALFE